MGMDQPLTFGSLLRRLRRASGLTQEELAERAELSVEAVSALERGVSRAPHKDTVALLADALGLSQADRALFEAVAHRRDAGPDPAGALVRGSPPAQATIPLVGRAHELALLDRHLAGKGPLVLFLAGEPGIGKTRLLREAAARGRAAGWTVLAGTCHRRSVQDPYSPLLGALQSRLRAQSPAQLRNDLRQCAWLARLLPELVEAGATTAPTTALAPEQERRLTFGAVSRFLSNVAGPAGVLLVLDDLQWAGGDALDLLTSLVLDATDTALRVVGAYRDTEVPSRGPLAAAQADLARGGMALLVKVGPLGRDESADLLRALLPESQTGGDAAGTQERILERAGGVPFFLVSCAQGVRDGALTRGAAEDVPWDAAETIRQRIAALPDGARALLEVAAVMDQRAPRAVLLRAATQAGQDEDALLPALDGACRTRVLTETTDGGYRFANNLIREVIWGDIGPARRAALHRRVADALAREPGATPPEVMAYHLVRGDERERAVAFLERAGDAAQGMYAHAAAEAHYRELAALLDDLGRAAERGRTLEKLGAVLRIRGEYDEALGVLERAVLDYRAVGDVDGQRQALAAIGRVHARRGTPDVGIARIGPSSSAGMEGGAPTPGMGALQVALADLYYASGRYRDQLAAAERAIHIARALGDDRLLTQAEQWRSTALLTLGRSDEAIPALEGVIPAAEALGDLSSHLHALHHVALAYIDRGEFAKSDAYIQRAMSVADVRGDPVQEALLIYSRGVLGVETGDWKQARADFERAAASLRRVPTASALAYPLAGLGTLCLFEGQWEAASQHLQEAVTMAERSGDLQALRGAVAALVERDLLEGRPEVARARLDRLLGGRQATAAEGMSHVLAIMAWASLELGDMAQAHDLVVRATTDALAAQNRLALVEALRVRAMLATRLQRWQEAEASLDEALALCAAMRAPYAEARIRYLYGLLDAARGLAEQAQGHLSGAAAILRGLGERLYAELVERATVQAR